MLITFPVLALIVGTLSCRALNKVNLQNMNALLKGLSIAGMFVLFIALALGTLTVSMFLAHIVLPELLPTVDTAKVAC